MLHDRGSLFVLTKQACVPIIVYTTKVKRLKCKWLSLEIRCLDNPSRSINEIRINEGPLYSLFHSILTPLNLCLAIWYLLSAVCVGYICVIVLRPVTYVFVPVVLFHHHSVVPTPVDSY